MKWTIPNTLTVLRLFATLLVPIAFLYFTRPLADWVALIIFSLAAITDYLDGYLARLWKQHSRFGAMLDPIADKAMVIIALLVISGFSGMDPWLLLPSTAIIFREVFVAGLREYLSGKTVELKVTYIAKWKTTVQMGAIAWLFVAGIFDYAWIWTVGITLLTVSAAMTVYTGWDYLMKAMPHLRDKGPGE
jgi:CDP-diacylglycerol--glycerol-3-phosphate 3-phosphatidyltransferase